MSPLSVDAAFQDAWRRLEAAGIDSARTDARLLLGRVLGGGAERVLAEKGRALSEGEATDLEALLARRLAREPMSHILGAKEFWSLDFKVTADTLTPRPDTETVIEAMLDASHAAPKTVLDLGTGTGCILLSLLSEWKTATGVGVDASRAALDVAQANAQILGMSGRSRFVQADWTRAGWDRALEGPFDVIVSNPPYIPSADIEGLDADVRDYEPRLALDGGADGLDAYRILIKEAARLVADGGVLGFEVGIGQAADVAALMTQAGFENVTVRNDLGGIARAVLGRKKFTSL